MNSGNSINDSIPRDPSEAMVASHGWKVMGLGPRSLHVLGPCSQPTAFAAARPAAPPEKIQPPRKVPSSALQPSMPPPPNPATSPAAYRRRRLAPIGAANHPRRGRSRPSPSSLRAQGRENHGYPSAAAPESRRDICRRATRVLDRRELARLLIDDAYSPSRFGQFGGCDQSRKSPTNNDRVSVVSHSCPRMSCLGAVAVAPELNLESQIFP